MKKHLPLIAILLLASFLRLYHLGSLPISLFGDELDVGYQAASLWSTGRDYMGNLLPTYIHSLSEWRAPLLMYVTAPFVGILGMSAFAVRLPVALLGILNIYLVYLLVNLVFKNYLVFRNSKLDIGIIASFFLAISPWHIHYSRAAFEVTLLLFLILLGTYLFIQKKLSLSLVCFVLTFYTYSTANLFTPLLIFVLFLIYRPKVSIKTIHYFLIPIILTIPIAYQLLLGPAAGRFKIISIFNDPKITDDVIVQRTQPWITSTKIEPIFHNKIFAYSAVFGRQYLQAFSTDFLFVSGDPLYRQSVGRFGELPWMLFPFLIIGVVISLRGYNLMLAWLLIAPIPSALTQDGGTHATRLFIMLPPLIIFSAIGFMHLLELINSKIKYSLVLGTLLLVILAAFFTASYWHHYSTHYKYESAPYWNYGYQQAFDQLKTLQPSGRVFINNTYAPSLLRFIFYTQLPPKDFQQMFTTDVPQANLLPGFDGFKFGEHYYFGQVQNQGAFQKLLAPGDLYLAVQLKEIPGDQDWIQNPPRDLQIVSLVKDVYGNPLFSWIGSGREN